MNAKQEHYQTAQQDLPCVWMMAGVLCYKLCDRQYRCEQCDLDAALRGTGLHGSHQSPPATVAQVKEKYYSEEVENQVNNYLSQVISGSRVYLDRCYSSSHFWMYPEDEELIRVGLDMNMIKLLYPLSEVVPPETHTNLIKNQLCTLLIRNDMTIPLYSPFRGEVIDINPEVHQKIAQGATEYDDEWFLKMIPSEKVQGMDDLCSGDEMLRWYVQKIQLLKRYLRIGLSKSAIEDVGMTMADGGETQLNLELILGEQEYQRLVKEIFQLS